jgi:C4-dicarboxylate-binding protein DctP
MKKSLSLLLVVILCAGLILSGCQKPAETSTQGNSNNDTEAVTEPITIKVAHAVAESHASHIALQEVFKKEIEEKSGGRLVVEIYPNAQLGSDRQAFESVSMGSLEMTMCTMAIASGFEEKVTVLDLPFLFKTKEAVYNALDGELGAKLNELLVKHNVLNLGYAEGGFRHITNSKRPITKPEDLNGIKLRTQENPIHVAAFKAFGANPTPMAFGELFTALQQKTVDGQENPINLIYASKFHEVQKYLTLTGHVYGTACFFVNNDFFNKLPEDLQKIVQEAADKAKDYQRQLCTQQDDEYLVELEKVMEVYELTPEEKQAFVDKAAAVYEEFEKKHGSELIELAQSYNE